MFQLVDAHGNRTGAASREECHGNPRLIHLVVHLHVFDTAGRLYLQKRSARKDTNPGRWDTSVGGHVGAGESVPDALVREAREELGIDASAAVPLYSYLSEGAFESEYVECFMLESEQPIHADPGEIDAGRHFTLDEVQEMIGTGLLTPMFEGEWPMLRDARGHPGTSR
ncbi:MAG: NUDIX hydrolase [Spirochaetia bacterium]